MVTEEDVRQVALSLPGSAERPYNRLPSFRAGGKLFLRIHELPDVFFVRCAGLEERAPKRLLAAYEAGHLPAP